MGLVLWTYDSFEPTTHYWHCTSFCDPIYNQLSEPPYDGPGDKPTQSMFSSAYVKWLSQAGARVAPLRFDLPLDQLHTLFKSVNGLFFTGGMDSLSPNTTYFKTASALYDWAKKANDAGLVTYKPSLSLGDYFPVWGTCQGFQLLSILAAQDQTVLLHDQYDSWNLSLPLRLTSEASTSRFFAGLPASVVKTLTTTNATQNLHHNGVLPSSFDTNANLKTVFKLLSTNVDLKGKPFGSTMEGRTYPFYATQWHPERNQFDWGLAEGLDKSEDALIAMQEVTAGLLC